MDFLQRNRRMKRRSCAVTLQHLDALVINDAILHEIVASCDNANQDHANCHPRVILIENFFQSNAGLRQFGEKTSKGLLIILVVRNDTFRTPDFVTGVKEKLQEFFAIAIV